MTNKTRDDNPGPARAVEVVEVTGGVDTHADAHTAAAVDQIGGLLGTATFPATAAGYRDLASWLAGFGPLARVGVEGTGSYGAGLTRHLTAAAVEVVEVTRPNRADRRNRGKTDTLDAVHAARAALAGTATGTPKTRDGIVESIRVLHVTRRGAVKARTATRNEFAGLLVTAPEPIRAALAPLTATQRASERSRSGLSPAVISSCAAVSAPIPTSWSSWGAACRVNAARSLSRLVISVVRCWMRWARARSAVLVAWVGSATGPGR
jgi:transposase